MTRTPDGRGRERRTGTILPSVSSAREHGCPPPRPDTLPPRRGGRPSSKTASAAAGRPASFAGLADARRALVRSARAVAAVACLCLAGPLALPAQAQTTNFYLWRTTMTVGESSGFLGYVRSSLESWGELSTGAQFNYPPWSPPHKHHFDPAYQFTVKGLYIDPTGGIGGVEQLILEMGSTGGDGISVGNITLWIGNTSFPLGTVGGSTTSYGFAVPDVPDLDWSEDDEVGVVLSYTRELPSAPKNVSVTAPPGEDGTLEVSWKKPKKGTFPIECYLVEFRHPSGEAKKRKQSYPGSLGPGKGCGDSPPTSVRRTDLEPGVEYQVLVQALSGDGFSEWSETKTVRANGRDAAVGPDGVVRGHADEARRRARVPLPRRVQRGHRDQLLGAARGCVHGDRRAGQARDGAWPAVATCSR